MNIKVESTSIVNVDARKVLHQLANTLPLRVLLVMIYNEMPFGSEEKNKLKKAITIFGGM